MNRTLFILSIVAVLCSCENICVPDEVSDGTHFEIGQKVTVSVSSDTASETKVTGVNSTSVVNLSWDEGDEILVSVGNSSAVFKLISGAGTTSGVFSGTMPASGDTYSIQYPVSYDASTLASQDYVADRMPKDKLLLSKSGCTLESSPTLEPQQAVLCLSLWGDDVTLGKIVITNTTASDPKPTYTLNCGSGVTISSDKDNPTQFLFVVPIGSYKFKADLYDNQPVLLRSYQTGSAKNLGSNLNMPAINVDPNRLPGLFSVSETQQVNFSKGNLQATYNGSGYDWGFAEHQYDIVYNNPGNTTIDSQSVGNVVDLFGWSTSGTYYGINTSTETSLYTGTFVDWGKNIGNGSTWRTLSKSEFSYLIGSSTSRKGKYACGVTVCGVGYCLVLAPDECLNGYVFDNTKKSYSDVEWTAAEAGGLVCLPISSYRYRSSVYNERKGYYWTSSPNGSGSSQIICLLINSSQLEIFWDWYNCCCGHLVRLASNAN